MNRHTYSKELENLKQAVATIRDSATGLSDVQNNTKDPIDCADFERAITLLNLAAELVEKVLPGE